MSASSLLEQVQAQPACLGHCVRRDGARLGPGPPPPVWPSRAGASRGQGFGPLGPAAPSVSRLARSSRFSPGLGTHRPRRAPSPHRAWFSFLVSFPFLEALAPSRRSWRVPRFFSRGRAGLALFPASRFQPPPHHHS